MRLTAILLSLSLCFSTLCSCTTGGQPCVQRPENVAAKLAELDDALSHFPEFTARKADEIRVLRAALAKAQSDESRFDIAYGLFEQYRPVAMDSALHFLDMSISGARRMGDRSRLALCSALKAHLCSNAGTYVESLDILHSIDTTGISREAKVQFYYAMAHVCGEMAFYTPLRDVNAEYGVRAYQYRQRICREADPRSDIYFQVRQRMALDETDTLTSMAVNNEWMQLTPKGSHAYALAALCRSYEYYARGDVHQEVYWLTEAALTDIRNGVMDQGAMQEIANILIEQGDINRAYRYICFTSDCAYRFGSRQRLSSLAPLFSRVAQQYKEASDESQHGLRLTLALISVLSVLLLAAVFFLVWQRNTIRKAKDSLARSNSDLTAVNDELSSRNMQLDILNTQREAMNRQIVEAGKVKEEYVGRFMRLSSAYVDRLQSLRLKVKTLAMAGKWPEIKALVRSDDFNTDELDGLYANFDAAFLHLYPDFVSQFNALLTPDAQVVPSAPGRLTTQMRIFALIRLGITDSGKISEILHYSVNTIYNYRAQTKKSAACPKDDFEERVREINA